MHGGIVYGHVHVVYVHCERRVQSTCAWHTTTEENPTNKQTNECVHSIWNYAFIYAASRRDPHGWAESIFLYYPFLNFK